MSQKRPIDRDYVQALVSDFRHHMCGNRSSFGLCGDFSYFIYDFLRKKIPDIKIVYGVLTWNGHEPFAHWWNASKRMELIIDASNPFVSTGFVGSIYDSRYAAQAVRDLTRKELHDLRHEYYGLSLDDDFYRNFDPNLSIEKNPTVSHVGLNPGLYHVTDPETAELIIKEGFAGGYGDVGFGAYFYDNIHDALAYAKEGGWDGKLRDYAVVGAVDLDGRAEYVRPDPGWPNPEDYQTVKWVALDQDDDARWTPPREIVATGRAKVRRKR